MTQYYDVFIAGGGLGGLIASALLTQQGKSVYLSERLPFFGGRFTTHNLDGYEIPTGAVHMIPHSQRGILGQILLKKLSLPLNIVDTHNFTTWYWDNHHPVSHRRFWGILRAFPKWKQRYFIIRKLLFDRKELHDNSITFDDYLSSKTDDPQIFNFFNAFTGFALSLDISELTPATMFRFVDRLHKSGKAGVPIGGCKRVSENLVRFSRNMGGTLKNNSQLILLEKNGSELNSGVVCNTRTNEESEVKAKEFILNLGVNQINSVLEKSKFDFRLPVSPGAIGGGFVFSSKRSLLKKSTVAQFPDCKYVKGAVEPTLISPELAPKGRHLFLTHQVFRLKDVVTATKRARDEVLDLFPSLQEEDELCVHTFHRNWPVNNAMQGADNKNISDIFQNLSFVGDGFKGNTGWFMSEGVAYGAQKVVKDILNKKS
ncbi:MAG: NAD(P)-binding protein [Candidatus Hodarchaeales archaeon]